MADSIETTFGSLETDKRLKKLERSLKLTLLRREHKKKMHKGETTTIPTWPSISSINVDTLDSSIVPPSLQVSLTGSEVLASSNLKMFPRKRGHNTNEVMVTSSVKHYNVKQNYIDQRVMPPPTIDKVYHKKPQVRTNTLSDCGKLESVSLNNSIQSSAVNDFSSKNSDCVTVNTNNGIEHTFVVPKTYASDSQNVDRVFVRWRVMLNNQYQLIIKGTLECGKVARSKPVIKRYTATCIESIYKHKYGLRGNIVDERNELPDYIYGKFFNGFPDDWENVYEIWRTFVKQGCPVTFRWPTPVTDSDDDLKSELTDLTYAYLTNSKTNTVTNHNYKATKSAGHKLIKPENPSDELSKAETYLNYSHSLQSNCEKNRLSIKPVATVTERDVTAIVQTKDTNDKDDVQDIKMKSRINVINSREMSKLKDIFQENYLNNIINLDKNYSAERIDRIIKWIIDDLVNILPYKTESRYNSDSVVSTNYVLPRSETIPLQQIHICNKDNRMNADSKPQNTSVSKSHVHSSLGYGSIKNDSNPVQLSARSHVELRRDDRSDRSEDSDNEIYAGVPRISMEQVLRNQRASRKTFSRKTRRAVAQKTSPRCNTEHESRDAHSSTISIANAQKNLHLNESCVSITEEEIETPNTRRCHRATNVIQRPQEIAPRSYQEPKSNNSDVYDGGSVASSVTRLQNMQALERRGDKSNFAREQRISHRIRENIHAQATDVDYTTGSDVERNVATTSGAQKTNEFVGVVPERPFNALKPQDNVRSQFTDAVYVISSDVERDVTIATSARGTNKTAKIVSKRSFNDEKRSSAFIKEHKVLRNTQASVHSQFADIVNSDVKRVVATTAIMQKTNKTVGIETCAAVDQDLARIRNGNADNNNSDNQPLALRKKFIEQQKSEAATTRAKPTVVSSVPVNFNLKISCDRSPQKQAQPVNSDSNSSVTRHKDKQRANVHSTTEEIHKRKSISTRTLTAAASDLTIDSKKEDCATSNNIARKSSKSELDRMNAANSTKSATNSSADPQRVLQVRLNRRAIKGNKLDKSKSKVLTAWMPEVVYDSKSKNELGLIFHGKLLNEVGHVIHRKFTTDIVLKRISATLIETVNHELYELLRCLNRNHDIPKELMKQCRNGCPAKIEQFCTTWKSLQYGKMVEKVEEKSQDASMDMLSVPVSSRGRRMLPPLRYWTGERIALKDNTPVYNPGNSQESLLTSLNESASKRSTDIEKRKRQEDSLNALKENDANKQKPLSRTNEISSRSENETVVIKKSQSSNKSPQAISDATKRPDKAKRYRKSAINNKMRIVQQLTFSSTDFSEEEEVSPRKRIRNSQLNTEVSSEYTMKLRKRQKTEASSNKVLHENAIRSKYDMADCSPTKNPGHNVACTYYRGISLSEDTLSEDQISHI